MFKIEKSEFNGLYCTLLMALVPPFVKIDINTCSTFDDSNGYKCLTTKNIWDIMPSVNLDLFDLNCSSDFVIINIQILFLS